jgi:hypothetical protein
LEIDATEWESVKVVSNKDHSSLKGHIPLITGKLQEFNPYCVLKFTHNRVRKENSRKTNTAYFHGKAVCKFSGCTKYKFTIKKRPRSGKRIKIHVNITGQISHKKCDMPQRRHIRGKQRVSMAKLAKEKGPAEVFYHNLSAADEDAIKLGNLNNVPSKAALRQMLHEVISSELEDRDVFKEIDIISETLKDIMPGGYIQYFAKKPLNVIMYTDAQISFLHKLIKEKSAEMYLDATGSVVDKVPEQDSSVLYYALVVKGDGSNPIYILEKKSSMYSKTTCLPRPLLGFPCLIFYSCIVIKCYFVSNISVYSVSVSYKHISNISAYSAA